MLLPTSDSTIDFLARHAAVLGEQFRFQDSYASGIAADLVDKASFLRLSRQCGLAHPDTAVAHRAELPSLAGGLA